MRGWMLAGVRRGPGPLIGTVVASAAAAALTVAAISAAVADTSVPAGRLAGANVVVAGDTNLVVTVGHGEDARQSLPLAAYQGVPAALAGQLARVPGVAAAAGESGFPGGVVRPGDVDLVAVTAKPGVPPDVLAGRVRAALHGGQGYTIATGPARGDVADLNAAVERSDGQILGAALIPPIVLISLFVLAATTGLAVNLRRRRFALLRTVGADRGRAVGPARAGRDRGAAAPHRLGGHPGRAGGRHGGQRLLRRRVDRARHLGAGGEHRNGRPGDLRDRARSRRAAAGPGAARGPRRGRGGAGQRGGHRPGPGAGLRRGSSGRAAGPGPGPGCDLGRSF
jgi:hypothetical protein